MVARLCLVLFSIFVAQPALAQAPNADVVLTPASVETVVTAYPLMRQRLEDIGEEFDDAGADSVASSLQALALSGMVSGALDSAAHANGFDSFMDWVNTTHAVFLAHAFAQNGGMDAQVQEALDNIDSQPRLSAAQKGTNAHDDPAVDGRCRADAAAGGEHRRGRAVSRRDRGHASGMM